MSQNKRLGKGLSALINESKINFMNEKQESDRDLVSISSLSVGKFQPRNFFDEESLLELAKSIERNGIISPIIVRPIKNQTDRYEIIAGERRWRASKIANLKKVPIIIKDISDKQVLEYAIVENVQRQDLTSIEEAESYQRLISEFSYTQEELKEVVGKSRSHIANILRLLSLPNSVQNMIKEDILTFGHAKALIGSEEPEKFANEIIEKKLNVRQAEKLIKESKPKNDNHKSDFEIVQTKIQHSLMPKIRSFDEDLISNNNKEQNFENQNKSEDIKLLEESLSKALGFNVLIEDKKGDSKLIIKFESLDQLDNLLEKFNEVV